jgi:drug/metabolite transporter (DMT)-like permease
VTGGLQLWISMAILYVVWGSTYLAIKIAIKTLPPFLMASARFLVAGAVLFAITLRSSRREGTQLGLPQWRASAIVGAALLFGGNGGVVWAEGRIDSGVAALVIATVPLWMAIVDRIVTGERLPRASVAGLVLGFAGLALLVGRPGGHVDSLGVAVALGASLSWAAGSVYARRASLPRQPLLAAGMEMLCGGAVLLLVGVAGGELSNVHLDAISLGSAMALLYLIVIGSLVAFSAYAWLLSHAKLSLISTYAYVNPVVAVFLGWAVLSEPITGRTILASAVIVAAVALIVASRTVPRRLSLPTDTGPCEPGVEVRPQEARRAP